MDFRVLLYLFLYLMELSRNFQYAFWRQITLFYVIRGLSGNHATSKIEIYAKQVYGWNIWTTGLKIFILDVVVFPDPPLVNISLPYKSDNVQNQARPFCKKPALNNIRLSRLYIYIYIYIYICIYKYYGIAYKNLIQYCIGYT